MNDIFKQGDVVVIKSWEEMLTTGTLLSAEETMEEAGFDYIKFPNNDYLFWEFEQYLCGLHFTIVDTTNNVVAIIDNNIISTDMIKLYVPNLES